jgi:hypothetical protein
MASAERYRLSKYFSDFANLLSCSGSLKKGALDQALDYSPISLAKVGSMDSAQMV